MQVRARSRLFLALASLLATALVIILALQNRSLRAEYRELEERTRLPHAGLFLPTFRTTALGGEPVTIGRSIDGERQVLFIFDTRCPHCRASLPAWGEIAGALSRRSGEPPARAYGISLDPDAETRAYVQELGLPFPVLTFPEPELAILYRARLVPQTLVLDSAGRVVFARPGAIEGAPALDSVLHAVMARPTGAGPNGERRR